MATLVLSLVGIAVPALFAAAYRHPIEYALYILPFATVLIAVSFACLVAFGFAIDLAMEETQTIAPLTSTYALEQLRQAIDAYQPRKRWYVLHVAGLIYLGLLYFLPNVGLTSPKHEDRAGGQH